MPERVRGCLIAQRNEAARPGTIKKQHHIVGTESILCLAQLKSNILSANCVFSEPNFGTLISTVFFREQWVNLPFSRTDAHTATANMLITSGLSLTRVLN